MKKAVGVVLIALVIMLTGCSTNPYSGESQMAKSAKYGMIAATVGGVVGGLIAGKKGAMIGAGLAGVGGGGFGYYRDVQERKLRQQLAGSQIEVQRNQDQSLTLTMKSDITFDVGRAELKPQFFPYLSQIANSARQSNNTVVVVGHTDNTGSFELNQNLSNERARAVASYLSAQGIEPGRIQAYGVGYNQPIADNRTVEGRAQNRRVEITLR